MGIPLSQIIRNLPIENIVKRSARGAGIPADRIPQYVDDTVKTFRQGLETAASKNPKTLSSFEKHIKTIDTAASNPDVRIDDNIFKSVLGDNSFDNIKRNVLEVDTAVKSFELQKRFESVNDGTVTGVKNARSIIKFYLSSIDGEANNLSIAFEQGLSKTIKALGYRATTILDELYKAPKKIKLQYGVSEDDFFSSLISGDITHLPKDLQEVGRVILDQDKQFIAGLQKRGIPIGYLEDAGFNLGIPKSSYDDIGEDALRAAITQHTDLADNEITALVRQLKRRAGMPEGSGGQIGFAARNLKFKSPQAALSFYRTVNSIESDSSILSFWLRNKSRTLKKAVALSHLGNNPKETIERTIRKTFRGSADAKINLEVDRAVKEFNVKFDVYSGVSVIKSPAIRSVARGLSQILSLTTLSTARATVRNFFDFGGHALAFGNTLYDASSSIGGYANDTLRSLGFLGAHGAASLVKSGAKVRAQVDGILDILGYANAFDGLSKAGLLSVENVFDRPGGSGNRFLNSLFTANDSLYKLSGNSSLTDFRRVRKGITLQQTWNNILERGDYKTFVASLPEREAKQLNYLNAKFGIDEDVFNFLRKVNKITPEDQPELLKGFGFGKFPSFINRDSILETGDDIARQFKRQEETAEAFKSRVGNAWQRMIYEYIHHSVPTVRLGDSVTPYASDLPDIAVLLLLPGFKFADITNAQWQDGVRTARVSLYGAEGVSEFNNVGGAVKSFGKYSKAAGIYGGIFAGIVWTKDILNNRKPTDFTNEENVGRLMLTSGFLGLYTFGASNLLNAFHSQKRGIYTGTPLASAIDKAEKLGRAVTGLSKPNQNGGQLYNTIKSIHNSQGLTNLWYLKGVVDYTIYNSLLSPSEQNRENRTDRYYDREKLFQ